MSPKNKPVMKTKAKAKGKQSAAVLAAKRRRALAKNLPSSATRSPMKKAGSKAASGARAWVTGSLRSPQKTAQQPAEQTAEQQRDRPLTELERFLSLDKEGQDKLLNTKPNPTPAQYHKFHKAIATDEKMTPEIITIYKEIMSRKYQKGQTTHKERDLRMLVKRWILAGGAEAGAQGSWDTSVFSRILQKTHTVSREKKNLGVPWGRMIGLHGGNESVALAAWRRKEIKRYKNPKFSEDGIEWLYLTIEDIGS